MLANFEALWYGGGADEKAEAIRATQLVIVDVDDVRLVAAAAAIVECSLGVAERASLTNYVLVLVNNTRDI